VDFDPLRAQEMVDGTESTRHGISGEWWQYYEIAMAQRAIANKGK